MSRQCRSGEGATRAPAQGQDSRGAKKALKIKYNNMHSKNGKKLN